MYTRRAVFHFKADSSAEFTRILRDNVLPLLRSQEGCRHEDLYVTPQFSEAVLNSYWDTEARAEAYETGAYREGLQALAGVLDGAPRVESFNVSSATFRVLTAARRETYRASRIGRG